MVLVLGVDLFLAAGNVEGQDVGHGVVHGLQLGHESVEEVGRGAVHTGEDLVGLLHEKGHLASDR